MPSRSVFSALLAFLILCPGCRQNTQQAAEELEVENSAIAAEIRENVASPTAVSSSEYTNRRDILLPGHFRVDVVDLDVPPRIQELTQRLLHAIREDPELWTRLVNQAGPGEPPPYDPALSLSKTEYEELLDSDRQTRIKKYADAILVITEDQRDVLRLDGEESLPELTGIEIDLNENVVRTPYGILTRRTEVEAPKESVHGTWKGTEWRHQSVTSDVLTDIKFAVGRLGKDGRKLLYYEVKKVGGAEKTRISRTLYFDLPGGE